MLDGANVDDVFEYVRKQTNKIDPVLDQSNYKPGFVDQLVESYIADIALFLMEVLGPKRAEIFKRRHLNMRETAFTTARSPDPTKMSGNSKTSDLVKIEEGGIN